MDAEEIQNRLANLSRKNFKRVVELFLKRVLHFESIDVDGAGDGGSDWLTFDTNGDRLRIGIQDTTQVNNWEDKALSDADNAKTKLNVNQFLFFTNRHHYETTITDLERRITKKTKLPCRIYESRRISELLWQKKLGDEFLVAIGVNISAKPPEMPEICLCNYTNLSADRKNHKEEVYRDTLLTVCYDNNGPQPKENIISAAAKFLAMDQLLHPILDKQIDNLLAKGKLRKTKDGNLDLSVESRKDIQESERLYISDWTILESAQEQLIKVYASTSNWSSEDSRQATVYVARMFLQEQLTLLRKARVDSVIDNWSARIGNPEQQLRDLLQTKGVAVGKLSDVISELVDLAKDREIINKLIRTISFVALEGKDPTLSATALGRRQWSDIKILIDSSVAIPFVCEKISKKSKTYSFALSGNAASLFQQLGASCYIIAAHIEEFAAHLLRAYRYGPIENDPHFINALRLSENAFIAYYGSLKSEGHINDVSIGDFLETFSPRANSLSRTAQDMRVSARLVMPDIQDILNDYDIKYVSSKTAYFERDNNLKKSFDLACASSGRDRDPILRTHDVEALSHLCASTEQFGESWMMLTWDKLLIEVSSKELTKAFVVSPETAMDFAQPCQKLTDAQWCSLAHRLAKMAPPSDGLTARIIDRVTRLNPDKLIDVVFRKSLLAFRNEAIKSLPSEDDGKIQTWIERQTNDFIKQESIKTQKTGSDLS